MRHDLFMSGFGGQGVLLAGTLLAHAAIIEGKNVSFLPSYGVEKRGGAANCTVVIADGDVGSPVIGNPSVGVILNQLSMDKYAGKIKTGGICIINSSLVDVSDFNRDDVEVIALPMNAIAQKVGDPRMVNMVAVGAYAARTGVVSLAALASALTLSLPERNHKFIPANIRVLEAGAAEIVADR
ncbi:MAG: 2-oxoacid:acceptor oxidoreductase family protein [Geobacteraceae bacterium]